MAFFFTSRSTIPDSAPVIPHVAGEAPDIDPALVQRIVNAVIDQLKKQVPERPKVIPLLCSFLVLGLLFWGATENNGTEIGKSLLRCFEILFTGFIALFGIEAAKSK